MPFESLEIMAASVFDGLRPIDYMSVTEAAQKYVMIRQPGAHIGHWSAEKTPYNVEIQDTYTSLDHTAVIDVGPARTGKALALDTSIATPTGWTTMGEIKAGDHVFDERGQAVRVRHAMEIQVGRPCYAVEFSDGETIVADAEHEWVVSDCHKPGVSSLMTTTEMLPTHRYGQGDRCRYSVALSAPLVASQAELSIDPYVLGAWLGDGTSSQPAMTCGAQDVDNMVENLRTCGVPARANLRGSGSYYVPFSAHTRGRGGLQKGDLAYKFKEFGLAHRDHAPKYIPSIYLRASVEQRQALLQGLMDTDGHVDRRGQLEFCTTSPAIAEGFGELLHTLGYRYCLTKAPAAKKVAHRFIFFARSGDRLFRLRRKQSRLDSTGERRRSLELSRRYIRAIRPVPSVPVRCIEVSGPSHLYLAGRHMVPTHNSQKFLNWTAHTVKVDPTDMMLVHMAQHTAREWSKDDLEKFHRNSTEIAAMLRPGRQNDNTFDKEYIHGMRLEITWPTVKNLSGKTRRFVWLMDYDRMPDSIEGEGNAFDLGRKRTTTFKRFGMTVAESSPGREVDNPKWIAKTPHEAPPCKGILELYNRGDRRRWYWECPHCHEAFEPSFKLFHWPKCDDPMESAEQVTLVCPNNGCVLEPGQKEEMNLGGRWVKDGMIWLPERGEIVERPGMKAARSDIASFWLKGPAAGFQTWQSIVLENIRAVAAYDATGDEEPLRSTVNTHQGEPYTPKSRVSERLPEDLKAKAEDWGDGRDEGRPAEPLVPEGVRFLEAVIDVQARAFVVMIVGFAEGGDMVRVDGFKLRKSRRIDASDDPLPVDPGAYGEDWDMLVEEVMLRSYPLADGSGRRMKIKATGCDSGGREGVTHQAYSFWRRLRDAREGDTLPVGLHRRFLLIKGDGSLNAPRAVVTWPDSNRRDKMATARGDVPVVRLNVNQLKDQVANMLGRRISEAEEDTGGGMIRYPAWTPDFFFTQVTTEIRSEKGWVNPFNRRNEDWDLLVYALGLALRPDDAATRAPLAVIRYDRIAWNESGCPGWAAPWDRNDLVFDPSGAAPREKRPAGMSFAELGRKLT